jgi:hypothetical protein
MDSAGWVVQTAFTDCVRTVANRSIGAGAVCVQANVRVARDPGAIRKLPSSIAKRLTTSLVIRQARELLARPNEIGACTGSIQRAERENSTELARSEVMRVSHLT